MSILEWEPGDEANKKLKMEEDMAFNVQSVTYYKRAEILKSPWGDVV